MKALYASIAVVGALFSAGAWAQAPAGAIAQCKDGTYFTGASHKGACKGHQGVKTWLDKAAPASTATASDTGTKAGKKSRKTAASTASNVDESATATKKSRKSKKPADTAATPAPAPAAAPAAPAPAAAPPVAPKPMTPAPTARSATTPTPPTPASQLPQKPGARPGMVWVNSSSKVYHCPSDEWYGKTKEGSYMTEAAAKAAGNHAARGKECSG